MKTGRDPELDASSVDLSDSAAVESAEIAPSIILDFDAGNRVVGIEMLNARAKLAAAP